MVKKEKFYVFQEDLIKVEPIDIPVCVSEIITRLNNTFCVENMKKLRTEIITEYLMKRRYLILDMEYRKVPTKKGKILGITVHERINQKGEKYILNYYDKKAQQYILDHLYDMLL